jgi:hypothetical protein
LSRRVRLSNLLAASAIGLVLAGGTAYATTQYLITSSGQIKPSVLAQIESPGHFGRGRPGRPGPAGPTGPTGATGAQGSTGVAGAVAGYSASATDVQFSSTPDAMTTMVSKRLPAGDYLTFGTVEIAADALSGSHIVVDVTCSLTDTPDRGTPVMQTIFEPLSASITYPLTPNLGWETIPLQESVNSPTSASTLSITCGGDEYMSLGSSSGPLLGDAPVASVMALQTTTTS